MCVVAVVMPFGVASVTTPAGVSGAVLLPLSPPTFADHSYRLDCANPVGA